MLTEDQINLLPERIMKRLEQVQSEYIESIGTVIGKIGALRPSDVHRLQQLYNYGADMQRITQNLAKASGKNVSDIYEMFDIVAKENYNYAKPFYEARSLDFVPYEQNEALQDYVRALAKQTAETYVNLTQHTAFAVFSEDGRSLAPLYEANRQKKATSLSDTYTKVVDYAVTKAQLGTVSYQSAMREVMRAMAHSGVKTVDYATGYTRRLDTAVRQNVLWGIKQCNQGTADRVGEAFGADGYEISYHSNPRPSHAEMGGRQYAIGKARTVGGVYYPSFSDVEPLLEDYGCLHFKFSILLGVSVPAYSRKQLDALKTADRKTFTFEGKTYTGYEGAQLQRKIESAVRTHKDLATMAKAAGDDELRREAQTTINLLTGKYKQLADVSGLPTKMERMSAAGFRPVKAKTVDNLRKSGIIDNIKPKQGVQDVHYIGKIDKNIYKCVTEDIRTDEVIITDERIQHIKDRHPDDYELYHSHIAEVISNPDYIIEANKNNTAVLLKEIEKDNEKFKLILRLAVKSDPKTYKNSVISFWEIGETTWKKTLKNKKILYKSE